MSEQQRYWTPLTHEDLRKDLRSLLQGERLSRRSWFAEQRKTPAIVLNLDRRYDRWQRLTRHAESNGLRLLRVSALDASRGDAVVASSLVTETWDATLNSQYDRKTVSNACTPMTTSERCCAAGHLRIWDLLRQLGTAVLGLSPWDRTLPATYWKHYEQTIATLPAPALEDWMEVYRAYGNARAWRMPCIPTETTTPSLSKRAKRRKRLGMEHSDMAERWVQHPELLSLMSSADKQQIVDWYLILEDDACVVRFHNNPLQRELREILVDVVRRLPMDWDMCYLGYILPDKAKKTGLRKIREFVLLPYAWQLHGYLINGKCIRFLLTQLPINMPIDNFLATLMHEGELKVRNPLIATAHIIHHTGLRLTATNGSSV